MPLTIGELTGLVTIDPSGMAQGESEAKSRFSKLGDSLGPAGKVAGAAAGAGLAVGLAAGAAGALTLDTMQNKMVAQLGVSTEDAKRLGAVAGELYAGAYGDNLAAVGDAVTEVRKNLTGMATASASDLQAMTGQAISLSEAMGTDVAGSVNAVNKMLSTGLVSSAQEGFDVLAKAMQTTGAEGQDILDTFNEYSVQFSKLGIDGATAAGLMGQGMKAGARDVDVVADAFKELSIRVVDGSTTSRDAFTALGLDADQMFATFSAGGPGAAAATQMVMDRLRGLQGTAQGASATVGLFGTQSEDLGKALGALDLGKATAEIGSVAGASQAVDAALGNGVEAKMEGFKRRLEGMATAAVGLPGPFGAGAAALISFGPGALATLAPLAAMIGAQRAASAAATAAGAATAAAGGAQAAGATTGAVGTIAAAASTAGAWVAMQARAAASAVVQAASWALAAGASMATAIASTAVAVATTVAGWALMGAQALLGAGRIALAWLIALGPIGLVIAAIVGVVALIIANWDTIKNATGAAFDWVVATIGGAFDWVKTATAAAFSFLTGLFLNFTGPGLIIKHFDTIKSATGSAWQWVQDRVRGAVDSVISIIGWFGSLPGRVAGWFGSVASAAADRLGDLVATVGGIPGRILGAIGNLGGLLYGAGAGIVQGLINGVQNMIGSLRDKFSFITNMIPNWKGPMSLDRRLLTPTGRAIMGGLVDGIDTGTGALEDQLAGVTSTIAGTGTTMAGGLNVTGSGTGGGITVDDLRTALGAAVFDALHRAELTVDGTGVAKLVNRTNRDNANA